MNGFEGDADEESDLLISQKAKYANILFSQIESTENMRNSYNRSSYTSEVFHSNFN